MKESVNLMENGVDLKEGEKKVLEMPKRGVDEKKQIELSLNIGLALRIEQEFKLYSYRIISPEQYMQEMGDLINEYVKAKK